MTTRQEHQHPEAPPQIVPQTLNDYLEVMTKAVFQSGMSWKVVNGKWPGFRAGFYVGGAGDELAEGGPGFRAGFYGFEVARVASMNESAIDDLAADTRIIRNRRKIAATVHNAQRLIDLDEEYGGIQNYFRSHANFCEALKDIRKQFKYMGETGAYYWLYVLGEDVPDYEEFYARRK